MEKFNKKRTKHINKINKIISIIYHTPSKKLPLDWGNIYSILVIDFTGIGDVIMLIPFLRNLKELKHVEIDLLCNSYGKFLLEDQNLINNFILFDGLNKLNRIKDWISNRRDIKRIIKKISSKEYDLILEPRGDLRYIYFMHFLSGKIKASYDYTGGENLLNCCVKHSENIKHLVDDKLYFLEQLGIELKKEYRIPVLNIPYSKKNFRETRLKKGKIIVGIHAGASSEKKIWPFYEELVEWINQEFLNVKFLIFIGPNERKSNILLLDKMEKLGMDYIVSETNIRKYRNKISLCHMLICNDSGAAHIAGAEGILTFCIFGTTDSKTCMPLNQNVYVIEKGEFTEGRTMESVSLEDVEQVILERYRDEKEQ